MRKTICMTDYHLLLAQAWHASDTFDQFDVDSGNPDSLARFQDLGREDAEAQLALIDFVLANEGALREQLWARA